MAKNIEPHVSSLEYVTVIGSNSVQSTTNRVLCMFPADCGPLEPTEINSQSEFLKTYTDGGEISRKAHYAFLHALKHSQSLPLMCVRINPTRLIEGITNTGKKVFTKGSNVLLWKTTNIEFTPGSTSPENWVIAIGEYLFMPDVAKGGTAYEKMIAAVTNHADVSIEPLDSEWPETPSVDDFLYFVSKIDNYLTKYGNYLIDYTFTSTKVNITVYSPEAVDVNHTALASTTVTTVSATKDATIGAYNFVIAPNYPCKDDIFNAAIGNVVRKLKNGKYYAQFSLDVTLKGDTNTYNLSTYPDDTDASGNNMYLTAANELTSDFVLIPGEDDMTNVQVEERSLGDFGGIETNVTFDQDSMPLYLLNAGIAAIEELEGIRISILSDCGMALPAYQKRLTILAETLKALAVLSVPNDPLPAICERHVNNVGADTSYAWWGYPWNTDRSLVDFPVDLSPICYYLERLAANASANAEFAPIFGKQTGIVNAKNLRANVKLAVRNELQGYNINPIHYNKMDNISYFTNNLTALSALNVLQEEQTRRIVNKIRYEVDLLCGSYLSYDWDQTTCDLITEAIKNYFDKNIFTLLRTIDSVPNIVVELNGLNKIKVQVAVKPKGSVKYITVYYNILSMAA